MNDARGPTGSGRPRDDASGHLNAVVPANGEMARLTREMDWSATPVGLMAGWPRGLRSADELMLAARYPMLVW